MTETLAATAGNLIKSSTLIFTVALGSYNGSIKATDYILLKWDTTKNAIPTSNLINLAFNSWTVQYYSTF